MAEEIYIELRYNYDGHGVAMQSSLLLLHLLRERVSFTCIPINTKSDLPFPQILIRNPRDNTLSRYNAFNFQYPTGIENLKKDCENIKKASLEKRVVSAQS